MDLTLIFALQVLVGFVCFLIGLGLGSLIAAIWLRLAAFWLRLGKVNFLTAFNAAFTSNLIVLLFNFSIGFNTRLTMMSLQALEDNGPSRSVLSPFAFSPIYFVYVTAFGLLITAVIFRRIISKDREPEEPMSFSDSFALAALYFALSFAFAITIALLAFCIVVGILSVMK